MDDTANEVELEVSDLRADRETVPSSPPPQAPSHPRTPAPRMNRRQRIGALLATGAVLLAIVVILVSSPNSRETLGAVLHIPTPTATAPLSPGDQMVLLTQSVPWAVIRLDGKTIVDHTFQGSHALVLSRGRHTLDVRQPPFAEIHCTITAPPDRTDTCPLSSGTLISRAPLGTRTLDLDASSDRLSDGQRASLIAAIRAVVTSPRRSVTVRPGEHYVNASGAVVTTPEALTATLLVDVDTSGQNDDSMGGTPCLPLCDDSATVGQFDGKWQMSVAVQGHWRYTRSDGTVVADAAPITPGDSRAAAAREGMLFYQVDVTWDGQWRVTPSFIARGAGIYGATLVCSIGAHLLDAEGSSQPDPLTLHIDTAPATVLPDEACLLAGQKVNPNTAQGPSVHQAYFLYRFGVLLAANDEAPRLLPGLPQADEYERGLAAQLAGQLPS